MAAIAARPSATPNPDPEKSSLVLHERRRTLGVHLDLVIDRRPPERRHVGGKRAQDLDRLRTVAAVHVRDPDARAIDTGLQLGFPRRDTRARRASVGLRDSSSRAAGRPGSARHRPRLAQQLDHGRVQVAGAVDWVRRTACGRELGRIGPAPRSQPITTISPARRSARRGTRGPARSDRVRSVPAARRPSARRSRRRCRSSRRTPDRPAPRASERRLVARDHRRSRHTDSPARTAVHPTQMSSSTTDGGRRGALARARQQRHGEQAAAAASVSTTNAVAAAESPRDRASRTRRTDRRDLPGQGERVGLRRHGGGPDDRRRR